MGLFPQPPQPPKVCRYCSTELRTQSRKTDLGIVEVSLCRCDYLKCTYCNWSIGHTAKVCGCCGGPLPEWTPKP